jgi:DNA-binding NtrC family response regulator
MNRDEVRPLRDVEREYVLAALEAFAGNRSHTARALSISLRGLQYRLRKWRQESTAETPKTERPAERAGRS